IQNGDLTESKAIEDVTKQYFVQSDSVVAFLEEHGIEGKVTKDAYRMYVAYCEDLGLNAVGNTEFGRKVRNAGYESKQVRKDGKLVRDYANGVVEHDDVSKIKINHVTLNKHSYIIK